jgi:hypothetical protein
MLNQPVAIRIQVCRRRQRSALALAIYGDNCEAGGIYHHQAQQAPEGVIQFNKNSQRLTYHASESKAI